ncbi:MAG: hypothetical protein IJ193_03695 [Bacilli bacterium]|nr:hypothetical protein [Bacilli bacterium]
MKKHNAIKVVLITLAVFILLTWILPAASYSGEFYDQGRIQVGFYDLLVYPFIAISNFYSATLFILAVGAFYGILYKIPAYRNLLDSIANKFKAHGEVVIGLTMIVLAVATSVCGIQLGFALFFPFIASIILLMGYDKIVAALTLVGSTMIGVAGTTYGYENASILYQILGTEENGLSITSDIPVKVAILVVGLAVLIVNTLMYIKKHNTVTVAEVETKKEEKEVEVKAEEVQVEEVKVEEKKPAKKSTSKAKSTAKDSKKESTKKTTTKKSSGKKSSKNNNKAAATGDDVIVIKGGEETDSYLVPVDEEKKHSTWALICGFALLFVVLILAFVPWNTVFGLSFMEDALKSVYEFKIFGFQLFSKLAGTNNQFQAFGSWSLSDMIFVIGLVSVLLIFIYRVKIDDAIDGAIEGMKKALVPAIISVLVYVALVLNVSNAYQTTIYKFILDITGDFNVFTTAVTTALASFFNYDPYYAFQLIVPYISGITKNTEAYGMIAVISQAMYGFTMLIAPTSLVLMGTLSYLKVSYKDWLKNTWKFLLELLVVFLVIFTVLVLI